MEPIRGKGRAWQNPDQDFERFLDSLGRATGMMESDYLQLPVAGREAPLYRERVYCYELYHQLRLAMADSGHLRRYMLCGELDKSGHPYIRGNSLDRVKPDLVVHVPLSMTQNLVAIEVKPVARTSQNRTRSGANRRYAIRRDQIKKDLRSLTAFRRAGEYHYAIYLIYGDDDRRLEHIRDTALALGDELGEEEIDLGLIELHYHREAGRPAMKTAWS